MPSVEQAPVGWYRVHNGQVELWDGHAWRLEPSGFQGSAGIEVAGYEGLRAYWDGNAWVAAEMAGAAGVAAEMAGVPKAGSPAAHQREKRHRVAVWVWVAIVASVVLFVAGVVGLAGWWDAARVPLPDTQVMLTEFADEPDVPLTEEAGYSWEQRDGRLLLTPSAPGWQVKTWQVPRSSAVEAQANPWVIEGSASDAVAGVMVANARGEGVALVCDSNGRPTMFDLDSGGQLAVGHYGQCFDWPKMALVVANHDDGGFSADGCPHCESDYSLSVFGEKTYPDLNHVGIIFRSDEGAATFESDFVAAAVVGDDLER